MAGWHPGRGGNAGESAPPAGEGAVRATFTPANWEFGKRRAPKGRSSRSKLPLGGLENAVKFTRRELRRGLDRSGCVSAININSSNPQHPLVHGGGRARPRHGRATATQLQHRDTHPAAADARRPRRPAAAAGARETTNAHHHRQPPLYFGPSASLGRRTIYAALRTAHGALSAREDPYAPTSRRRPRRTDLTAPALAAPRALRTDNPALLLRLLRASQHHCFLLRACPRAARAQAIMRTRRLHPRVQQQQSTYASLPRYYRRPRLHFLSAPDLSVPAFTEDTTSSHPSIF